MDIRYNVELRLFLCAEFNNKYPSAFSEKKKNLI